MWKCYSEDQKILKKFIPVQYILKIQKKQTISGTPKEERCFRKVCIYLYTQRI